MPHGFATAFHTPQGTILHTGDFKLDLTPVDGRLTDLGVMGAIAQNEGIRLLLSDSTNADQHGHSRSETSVGKVLFDLFHAHAGRRIVTACFASHIHRIQQIADAADRVRPGRGHPRHVDEEERAAWPARWACCDIPESHLRDIEDVDDLDPAKVCVISTGSQGEPMSALALMAANDSRWLKLGPDDTVILSSHPIPGNEMNVSKVIDGLVRLGVRGRALGHRGRARHRPRQAGGAQDDPVGRPARTGSSRCTASTATSSPTPSWPARWAWPTTTCWCARTATRSCSPTTGIARAGAVPAGYLYVDGIVGDVGHGVLRDRRVLAEEGVVVVIVGVDSDTGPAAHRPRDHHPGLGPRPRGRGPARGGPQGRRRSGRRRRSPTGRPRHRGAAAGRAPGGRPVRERPHPPPADDRPRGHGGLTRRPERLDAIGRT